MNTILSIILIALIIVAFLASFFSIIFLYQLAKQGIRLRKEKALLAARRKYAEELIAEVEKVQQHVIDQAVRMAAAEMQQFIDNLTKDE